MVTHSSRPTFTSILLTVYKVEYIIKWADVKTLQMVRDDKISVHKAWKKAKSNEWNRALEAIELYQVSNNEDDK